MVTDREPGFPGGMADEKELFLAWIGYLRGAVTRSSEGVDDDGARWRPDGALISRIGIVNHLTRVEWRWIDGGMRGEEVDRSPVCRSGGLPVRR